MLWSISLQEWPAGGQKRRSPWSVWGRPCNSILAAEQDTNVRWGETSNLKWLMMTVFTWSLGTCGTPESSRLYGALSGAACPSILNKTREVNTWYISNTKSPERTEPSKLISYDESHCFHRDPQFYILVKPKESEIAGLYYCAFLAFHQLIKLNASDDMSVPQGENLSSEILMACLGQGRFQVTDPHGKAASVSHPRKLCLLLVWKSSTLKTAWSAQNSL